jgi:hypothetical protein
MGCSTIASCRYNWFMSRVLRAFVMWLIALTIPMQGVAADVMAHCAAAQHRAASSSADDFAIDGAGDSAGPSASAAQIYIELESGEHAADWRHHDGIAHDESTHSDHSEPKCCSATCSMAALTSPILVARTRLRLPAPLHPLAQLYRDVTPDGLERPPKHFLA